MVLTEMITNLGVTLSMNAWVLAVSLPCCGTLRMSALRTPGFCNSKSSSSLSMCPGVPGGRSFRSLPLAHRASRLLRCRTPLFLLVRQHHGHLDDHIFLPADYFAFAEFDQDVAGVDAELFGGFVGVEQKARVHSSVAHG